MITLMKASAGSGKTFNLAKTYIRILLESLKEGVSHPYRHILAVTFTNKATEEMKARILKELDVLAKDVHKSDFYEDFKGIFNDDYKLGYSSKVLLCSILNDYSAFYVSTIDAFFQQVLRAFSRELGQFESYQIEIDNSAVIQESVDRMLDELTESDTSLLHKLSSDIMEQLEQNGYYTLDSNLLSIAKSLQSSDFKNLVKERNMEGENFKLNASLDELKKLCKEIKAQFVSLVNNLGEEFESAFNGVEESTKSAWAKKLIDILKPFDLKSELKITDKRREYLSCDDLTTWFSKKNIKDAAKVDVAQATKAAKAILNLLDIPLKIFNTTKLIEGQLFSYNLYGELQNRYLSILKDKNIMCIEDSASLLSKIIDGSETPFIYEKTGVRFNHFLLDEFQDTSRAQWHNFQPLLANSISGGNDNLIVGDVKQSIYRWRNSDWKLLNTEIVEQFGGYIENQKLQKNYRSHENVVRFNNLFFKYITSEENIHLGNTGEDSDTGGDIAKRKQIIKEIYSDVEQSTKEGSKGGYVEIFSTTEEDAILPRIYDTIERLIEKNVSCGDIAVLVRGKKEGAKIAEYLLERGIPILSSESLKVSNSLLIRRLVALMTFVENPNDSIAGHFACKYDLSDVSLSTSLIDFTEFLLRKLRSDAEFDFDKESPYIQTFMDWVHNYVKNNGNQLKAMLDAWNKLCNEGNDPRISAPRSSNAVTIMTIHKSKGLDFPYVILPYFDNNIMFKNEKKWAIPRKFEPSRGEISKKLKDLEDGYSKLEESLNSAISNVNLSSKSSKTYFDEAYHQEMFLQYIDTLNIMYVAMTRAVKANFIISYIEEKSQSSSTNASDLLSEFCTKEFNSNNEAFYFFQDEETGAAVFTYGELDSEESSSLGNQSVETIQWSYSSWNPKGRLKIKRDAKEFFSSEMELFSNQRLRGLALHEIMSKLDAVNTLEEVVGRECKLGNLTREEADTAIAFLKPRVERARANGFLPQMGDKIMNERSLLIDDIDGVEVRRPDTIIEKKDGSIVIIDYKFGKKDKKYISQVKTYVALFKRMGYEKVSGYLWYMTEDVFEQV